jgi:hypothetical protein
MSSPVQPRRRRIDPEMLVAAAAVLISLTALVVSLVEVRIMREQQHMSVWPRLAPSVSNAGSFAFRIRNQGIGPAQVETVVLTVDGKPQARWSTVARALIGPREAGFDYGSAYSFSTMGGQVLLPGESITALTIPSHPAADSASVRSARMGVDICYCSIYRDCWRVIDPHVGGSGASTQRTEPAKSCEVPEGERFQM